MRLLVSLIVIALAAAYGCAKKAEEVMVVTECECEEPCPDCVCEEGRWAGGATAAAETPASAEEGP